ncbi:MAG: hypothetical protein QME52_03790 [Bacteroidota bacterium]|nr:hypothetical protein [Bacteroidota bacterium]
MKNILINLIWMSSFLSLSCINPFAPKLEKEFGAEMCNDLSNLENVFCTFRNAYTFKDTALYGSLIDPYFTFRYRDYDRGIDITWGRDDEMRTTAGLFQSVQSLSLVWNKEIKLREEDTVLTIVRGFNLTITFNPADIEHVGGYANMTFVRPKKADAWKLYTWQDESNF